jgi:hypothetical protein
MNSVTVCLSNDTSFETSFNGTFSEAVNYYLGKPLTRSDETTKDYVVGVMHLNHSTKECRQMFLTRQEVETMKVCYGIKEFAK